MKFRLPKNSKPIPVLLDEALRSRIEEVSEKMGEPKSTVMRIAMRIGLDGLSKAFETAKAKSEASISYPVHTPSAEAVNDKPPSSTQGDDIDREIISHLEEPASKASASKKRARRKSSPQL